MANWQSSRQIDLKVKKNACETDKIPPRRIGDRITVIDHPCSITGQRQ